MGAFDEISSRSHIANHVRGSIPNRIFLVLFLVAKVVFPLLATFPLLNGEENQFSGGSAFVCEPLSHCFRASRAVGAQEQRDQISGRGRARCGTVRRRNCVSFRTSPDSTLDDDFRRTKVEISAAFSRKCVVCPNSNRRSRNPQSRIRTKSHLQFRRRQNKAFNDFMFSFIFLRQILLWILSENI